MSRTEIQIPTQVFWRRSMLAYFAVLALIGFWPTPIDSPIQVTLSKALNFVHRHGMPGWVDYGFVEASANVLLFLPVGLLATLAFTNRSWWEHAALGMMASACVELGQWLFLPGRVPSLQDFILNTIGTTLGILVVYVQQRRFAAA